MALTEEQRVKVAEGLRGDMSQTELSKHNELLKNGSYHLKLAIEMFEQLENGTDVEDLQEYLEEAEEVQDCYERALGK